jgi:hypothetical protein
MNKIIRRYSNFKEALLPTASKLYADILKNKLNKYKYNETFLGGEKYGFSKGRNSMDSMLSLQQITMEKGKNSIFQYMKYVLITRIYLYKKQCWLVIILYCSGILGLMDNIYECVYC